MKEWMKRQEKESRKEADERTVCGTKECMIDKRKGERGSNERSVCLCVWGGEEKVGVGKLGLTQRKRICT